MDWTCALLSLSDFFMSTAEKTEGSEVKDSTAGLKEAPARVEVGEYVLRLYVVGMSPRSMQAIDNIKRICDEFLPGRYNLEVIDQYQQPIFAKDCLIVAASTLIKELPPPLSKLIGNMSNAERVLIGMDLRCKRL